MAFSAIHPLRLFWCEMICVDNSTATCLSRKHNLFTPQTLALMETACMQYVVSKQKQNLQTAKNIRMSFRLWKLQIYSLHRTFPVWTRYDTMSNTNKLCVSITTSVMKCTHSDWSRAKNVSKSKQMSVFTFTVQWQWSRYVDVTHLTGCLKIRKLQIYHLSPFLSDHKWMLNMDYCLLPRSNSLSLARHIAKCIIGLAVTPRSYTTERILL